jgi:DNA topoisomerase-1
MDEKRELRLLRCLGLNKVDPSQLALRRVNSGRGFGYRDAAGNVVSDLETRQRIIDLAIPPAWTDVLLADDPSAHIQAVGRDDAGRLQYIYHPAWEQVRSARKVEQLRSLGVRLPAVRQTVAAMLNGGELTRQAIIAAAVMLIDRAALRAGHEAYAGEEGGRGAATLLKRHVSVSDGTVSLSFPGKGGKRIEAAVADPHLAKVIAELKGVRGPRLFKLQNGNSVRPITAEDINAYLREVSGEEFTAKDFRTFRASAMALELFCHIGPGRTARERRRRITEVARGVAELLQNTPTVARSSYIHPVVLDAYEEGGLDPKLLRPKWRQGMTAAETGLMRLLDRVKA